MASFEQGRGAQKQETSGALSELSSKCLHAASAMVEVALGFLDKLKNLGAAEITPAAALRDVRDNFSPLSPEQRQIHDTIKNIISLGGLNPTSAGGRGVVADSLRYEITTDYDDTGARVYGLKLKRIDPHGGPSSVLIEGSFNSRTGRLEGSVTPPTKQVSDLLSDVSKGVDELFAPVRKAIDAARKE
jgi:hypothetical protein